MPSDASARCLQRTLSPAWALNERETLTRRTEADRTGLVCFIRFAMDCSTNGDHSDDHLKRSSNPIRSPTQRKHWYELTATLSPESTEQFGEWLTEELQVLVAEMESVCHAGFSAQESSPLALTG